MRLRLRVHLLVLSAQLPLHWPLLRVLPRVLWLRAHGGPRLPVGQYAPPNSNYLLAPPRSALLHLRPASARNTPDVCQALCPQCPLAWMPYRACLMVLSACLLGCYGHLAAGRSVS